MPGQALITIRDKQWVVDVASTSWELARGLGGLPELAPLTGMLFDLGSEQLIELTTVPMLFPLDIAFLSSNLSITEVYHGVEPDHIFTSQVPNRYFLEVNAGELEDIDAGDHVFADWLVLEETPVVSDWTPVMFSLTGLLFLEILVSEIGISHGY